MTTLASIRRAWVAGRTPAVDERLRAGELPAADVEVVAVPVEEYEMYFHVFNDLGRIAGVAADDHVTEEVELSRLGLLIDTLRDYPRRDDDMLDLLLMKLQGLCMRARERGLSVYVVF